jgi:carboxymethylenebutenolidase
MAIAMSALSLLESNYAKAETISEQDDDIAIEAVSYPGDGTMMKGYLAKPKSTGKFGSIIVIHENRGLTPHIKDITRRLAKAGYLAMAPDALSTFGGTPANEDEARTLIGKLEMPKNLNNYLKGLDYLKSRAESNGKTAAIGFCWGGALANQLAVNSPSLLASVPYYGRQPAAADVPKIKAEMMMHYGGLDTGIDAGIPAYEAALKAAGTKYHIYVYEGVNHAFNNDTGGARYDETAAKLAWSRTMELFGRTIK